MTAGPEGEVDVIADNIVNTFLRETEKQDHADD
jgi:hypothetical protein